MQTPIKQTLNKANIPAAKLDIQAVKAEMDHRTQNMFAMINSMVRLTGRHETEVKVAMSKLADRINALSTAQSIIHLMEEAGSVSVGDVLDRALEPYTGNHAINVTSEPVMLTSKQITPTSLILHELAANALVFGAFADPDGQLTVRVSQADGQALINWTETCAPRPVDQEQMGFGSQLIDRAADQLRGSCTRNLTQTGMQIALRFPIQSSSGS